ncbi:MAG: ABC transporter substrate-binding protein [Archaeoglobaceae archaeon]
MKRLLLLVFIILLFLGCMQEREVTEIKVSYQPGWHHVALFVIIEKGWDEKVLGKKLITTSFPSGPPQMEAFSARQHEIAYVGAAPPLSIISRGFDAKIVAVANVEGSSLVALPNLDFRGFESINGKKIMTYPPGSIQWTVLNSWLNENGIKAEIISASGAAEIREALKSGGVDFIFVPDPTPYIAVREGYGKIVMNSSEMKPMHPCCVVLMREDFIRQHYDLAVKFVALHIIASEYAVKEENRDEIVQILIKWLKIDEEIARKFPGTTNFHTDPRNETWIRGLEELCKAQYELGVTRDQSGNVIKLSAREVVDTTIYEEAIKILPEIKVRLGIS